jgi:hypothetical protein
MHGGKQSRSFVPRLPSLREYEQSNFDKPVLPPIGYTAPEVPSKYDNPDWDWKNRRNTFVVNADRRNRENSGQFHYPSLASRKSPWQKFKSIFVKDKYMYPPVFA